MSQSASRHYPFLGYSGWHSALVAVFLVLPLAVMVPISFTAGRLLVYPVPGFSLEWYAEFFGDPQWRRVLWNSVLIGLATTLISVPLGTMAALGLDRLRGPLRRLVLGLVASPIVLPHVVFAVSAFYFYSRQGLAGTFLGVVVGHTALALPFVVIIVSATLQGYDRNLTRAAQSLGASPLYAFRRITLPLVAPGVLSGAVFAFVTSFDELIMTLFIASPEQRTLPLQIWSGVQESSSPVVVAAAMILMLASVALMLLIEVLKRRRQSANT